MASRFRKPAFPRTSASLSPFTSEISWASRLNTQENQLSFGLCVTNRNNAISERLKRTGGRAVECTGLENRQGCKPFVGSNPTLSATSL